MANPNIGEIVRAVEMVTGIRQDDLLGPSRYMRLCVPRWMAWYLARRHTASSYPKIARYFGKDHSTVISGIRRVEAIQAQDPAILACVTSVEAVALKFAAMREEQDSRNVERLKAGEVRWARMAAE